MSNDSFFRCSDSSTYCSTNLLVGNGEPKIDGMYNISNPNHIISLKHLITQLKK